MPPEISCVHLSSPLVDVVTLNKPCCHIDDISTVAQFEEPQKTRVILHLKLAGAAGTRRASSRKTLTQPHADQSDTGEFKMTRTIATAAVVTIMLMTSASFAQTHDHFARQRQEAVARQAAAQHQFSHSRTSSYSQGHWGGPTTAHRYYRPTHGHNYQQSIQFYNVRPYGYGIPYYGYGVGVSPYNCSPYYGFPGGSGTYIHREIYLSR